MVAIEEDVYRSHRYSDSGLKVTWVLENVFLVLKTVFVYLKVSLHDFYFFYVFFFGGVAYTISSISSSAFFTLLNVLSCPFVNFESAIWFPFLINVWKKVYGGLNIGDWKALELFEMWVFGFIFSISFWYLFSLISSRYFDPIIASDEIVPLRLLNEYIWVL